MKHKVWLIWALFFSAGIHSLLAYNNRSAGHLDWNPLRFAALLGLMSAIFYLHAKNREAAPSYTVSLFLGPYKAKNHSGQYDYLRVFAVISVICVHTFNDAAASLAVHSTLWKLCTSLSCLFLTCNLIYVMISGALLLNMKEESMFSFYWKRFYKTAIPLFAYYLIYAAVHGGLENLYPANLPALFSHILSGPPDGAPHFWLIYVILSLYLTVPFLRLMMFHMTRRMQSCLVVFCLVFQAAQAYLPLFHLSLGLEFMLGAWEGVFILGYFLSQPAGKSWRIPMVCLGTLSAIITVTGIYTADYGMELYTNTVPTMTFMAAGIFSLADMWKGKLCSPGVLIRTLSHYSYSLILIHWYVLYYIVKDRLHINTLDYPLIPGSLLTILATLIFSYLIAWFYDNTIVFLLQSIAAQFQRLWKGFE